MSTSKRHSRVAYAEDAEEDSGSSVDGIEGTRQYATSVAPMSPTKEQPNTGKSRVDRRLPTSQRTSGTSSPTVNLTDSESSKGASLKGKESRRPSQQSDDHVQPDYRDRDRDRERRRRERVLREKDEDRRRDELAAKDRQRERERNREREAKPLKKVRPPVIKHQTQPVVQQSSYRRGRVDEAAAYGIQPAASSARPRAQARPASYYAGQSSRPPIANMGWHQTQHPPPFPVGTFPPQQHLYPVATASPAGYGAPIPPPSPGGPPGYFDAAPGSQQHSHLKQRFESRPSSPMGYQNSSGGGYAVDDYGDDVRDRLSRRPSRSRRTEDDRKKMPPPEFIPLRPQSAIPSTPFRPPPQRPQARQNPSRAPPSHRRSVGFVDQQRYEEDYILDDGLFQDSPESSYDQRRKALVRRPRRGSVAYEQTGYDIVPAGGRNRRASMYGTGALGSSGISPDMAKYQEALQYQDEVSGGPQMPLTAETLRKASKRGGVPSSRSTRSSGSHDDSEWKRSNTTGITRSSSGNNDDVTIKLSGGAVVRFPGAEIECRDGGEITFSRPQGGSRSGSDRASTVYPIEDARSRKALTQRARAPSQSDSQSRGHAPGYAPYDTSFAPANCF